MQALTKNISFDKQSKIVTFKPFLGESHILRIVRTLNQSELIYSEWHPVILPRNSKITDSLIQREYDKVIYCGADATLIAVRTKFWIPKESQLVKKIVEILNYSKLFCKNS